VKTPSKLESFSRTQECAQFQPRNSTLKLFFFSHLVRGSVKMQLNSECYITEINFSLFGNELFICWSFSL